VETDDLVDTDVPVLPVGQSFGSLACLCALAIRNQKFMMDVVFVRAAKREVGDNLFH